VFILSQFCSVPGFAGAIVSLILTRKDSFISVFMSTQKEKEFTRQIIKDFDEFQKTPLPHFVYCRIGNVVLVQRLDMQLAGHNPSRRLSQCDVRKADGGSQRNYRCHNPAARSLWLWLHFRAFQSVPVRDDTL
jgi:hypothetical protein